MIVEIGDTLVNTDNICSVRKVNDKQLSIEFIGSAWSIVDFADKQELEVAYQTLKFVETVIKK